MAKKAIPGLMILTWGWVIVGLISCASTPSNTPLNPLEKASFTAIHGFQSVISPVDGDRCLMRPSCSAYAQEAIKKHGFFMGWIMACDRLMRCGHDELYLSDIQIQGGETVCIDPVDNNDFWWFEGHP